MRKIYTMAALAAATLAAAQDYSGRVGINTTTPAATLDISELPNLPETLPQGVSFPNFTTAARARFTGVKLGSMIYNSDKKCIETFTTLEGVTDWYCNVVTPVVHKIEYTTEKCFDGYLGDIDPQGNFTSRTLLVPYQNINGNIKDAVGIFFGFGSAGINVNQTPTYHEKSAVYAAIGEQELRGDGNIVITFARRVLSKEGDQQGDDATLVTYAANKSLSCIACSGGGQDYLLDHERIRLDNNELIELTVISDNGGCN